MYCKVLQVILVYTKPILVCIHRSEADHPGDKQDHGDVSYAQAFRDWTHKTWKRTRPEVSHHFPPYANMDEEDWPLRVIKYWDDEEQEVVYGAKIREEPTELRKILGYYEWVFNACDDEQEVTPGSHGSLILVADKGARKKSSKGSEDPRAKDINPAHVKGGFETRNIGSAFVGLTAHGVSRWTFDATNLVETPDEENFGAEFDFDWSRFFIGVVDVVDDNGYPFLMFIHWPSMHESEVTYIGKKQKSVLALEGLTDGERQRLGIFVEEGEIERAALELKKALASARGGCGRGRRGGDLGRDRDREPDKSNRRAPPPRRQRRGRSGTRKESA
ncbi:hypothetical protein C8R45DRAFT_19384 [Mycena sanguinolenta]|nr:hypothetical protein C8R45DRAFT_19384 [Mycena sanguinolenta]